MLPQKDLTASSAPHLSKFALWKNRGDLPMIRPNRGDLTLERFSRLASAQGLRWYGERGATRSWC